MTITNTSTTHYHAALLCPPGMGHIIPFLELAKHLVSHTIITKVTLFIASINNKSSKPQVETNILQSSVKQGLFDIIHLPPIDAPANANMGTKLAIIMKESIPFICHEISTMTSPKPTILITELFGSLVLPIAEHFNMSKFVFWPSSAWNVALSLHTPTLDKVVEGEYTDQEEFIRIPGCNPISPCDLFSPFLDRNDQLYHEYLPMCEELRKVNGIFVNTFLELEAKTILALRSGKIYKVPIYPIGPLIREAKKQNCDDENRDHVIDWLDKQEEESVIYVSLGSGYTMSHEQIKEMALGLELSGKKFVWSLRPPSTKAGNDRYLTAGEDAGSNGVPKTQGSVSAFPDEFHKIQNRGLVVMDWAPQLEILKHSSIGVFVSHCGWNSILESVSCGVPIVGWPLFADQLMNAETMAKEIGIGIRLNVAQSTKVVGSEEIGKTICKIMDKEDIEGCAMRKRVKELKHIAEKAWSQDGPSFCEMRNAFVKISHTNGV
ncbi:UDP-glycosyltransferase 72D1-like [Arachis stenosperma]|uniref:UDP-glycosyltransferase 72D1-like n=1 Tax=Arachis stenosperma TaxID=217475 RepID=UPI0025AD1C5E|nr:UDP-glycosyltransferase 72D1-like [Arachis stenosperma]